MEGFLDKVIESPVVRSGGGICPNPPPERKRAYPGGYHTPEGGPGQARRSPGQARGGAGQATHTDTDTDTNTLTHPGIQNFFCFKVDAKSVPEALPTTFLIM